MYTSNANYSREQVSFITDIHHKYGPVQRVFTVLFTKEGVPVTPETQIYDFIYIRIYSVTDEAITVTTTT